VRGQLEQIDYTAFAANRAAISLTISGGHLSAAKFQRLAVATAQARSAWAAQALTYTSWKVDGARRCRAPVVVA